MQSTQKLFQVFLQRDQDIRPSRWFPRESLAQRYCHAFNRNTAPDRAVARYQIVEVPVVSARKAPTPK
jgi:hypothetical protein